MHELSRIGFLHSILCLEEGDYLHSWCIGRTIALELAYMIFFPPLFQCSLDNEDHCSSLELFVMTFFFFFPCLVIGFLAIAILWVWQNILLMDEAGGAVAQTWDVDPLVHPRSRYGWCWCSDLLHQQKLS